MATYTAPTHVGTTTRQMDGTASGGGPIAFPPGIAVGDYMILVVEQVATAGAPTNLSAWTLLASGAPNSPSSTRSAYVYGKAYATSDGTSGVTVTRGTTGADAVALTVWRHVTSATAGTGKARATAPAESTTSTALSMTTSTPNTVCVGIMVEATSATEGTTPTLSGGTQLAFLGQASTTQIETIMLGYNTVTSAGASPQMQTTYPNSQTNNGWGIQIALAPPADAVTSLQGIYTDGTQGIPVYLKWWDGTNLIELANVVPVWAGLRVPDFLAKMNASQALAAGGATGINTKPVLMAHRMGSIGNAEHSLFGATQSKIGHVDALEVSLGRSSDGVLFGLHDQYMDRVVNGATGTSLDPTTMTWATIQTYTQKYDYAGNSITPQPFYSLDQIVADAGLTHTIILDPKYLTGANLTQLMTQIQGYPDWRNTFIGKGYHTSTATAVAFHGLGLKAIGYGYQADVDGTGPSQMSTTVSYWDLIGMDYTANSAAWTTVRNLKAANANVLGIWGHIVPTKAAADTAVGYGASVLMISNVAATTQVTGGY